ncbi:MAG: HAD family hydrolase [Terriglobales bacterium]
MKLETLFFDAGGTLVFPDPRLTLAALDEIHRSPTQEQLYLAERDAKHQLDEARAHGSTGVDARYWQLYYDRLLREMEIADDAIRDRLVAATRAGINWRRVRPGTRESLQRMRQRYRLGIISNSDGSISRLLGEVGLGDCFDSVVDSHHCGAEKPDPRIFRAALESLGSAPERSLYVGDIQSVDYAGARAAGLHAVLMDVAGVYAGSGLPRVTSMSELESWIDL